MHRAMASAAKARPPRPVTAEVDEFVLANWWSVPGASHGLEHVIVIQ
jgi:hypothetical protein